MWIPTELLHNLKIKVIVTTWSTWKLSLWWQQCLLPRAAHGKNHGHHEYDAFLQRYLPKMLEYQSCRKNSRKAKRGLWQSTRLLIPRYLPKMLEYQSCRKNSSKNRIVAPPLPADQCRARRWTVCSQSPPQKENRSRPERTWQSKNLTNTNQYV